MLFIILLFYRYLISVEKFFFLMFFSLTQHENLLCVVWEVVVLPFVMVVLVQVDAPAAVLVV